MKLIGYFDGYLTVAEIQEISVSKPIYDPPEDYHRYIITAKAPAGAETRIYKIFPAEVREYGARYWETKEEATAVLEKLLSNLDIIDLRKCGEFYCKIDYAISSVRIENSWLDEDEIDPIVVRLIEE